jgi:anti-sigma B factor antagonist
MSTNGTHISPPSAVSEPALSVHVTGEGHCRQVIVCGEFDMCGEPLFTQAIAQVALDRPEHVVVDLAGVTFFGAAGVAALLTARETIATTGGQLFIRSPSRIIRRVLRITDADVRLSEDAGG